MAYGLVLSFFLSGSVRAQDTPATAPMLPLSITVLYFDQSSPLLRPRVKTTLDSLARLLIDQPELMATVSGYTDPIGRPELNLALARNRARAVVSYLRQRGVPASRITARWEGPDQHTPAPDQTIGRRVVVQLSPR